MDYTDWTVAELCEELGTLQEDLVFESETFADLCERFDVQWALCVAMFGDVFAEWSPTAHSRMADLWAKVEFMTDQNRLGLEYKRDLQGELLKRSTIDGGWE